MMHIFLGIILTLVEEELSFLTVLSFLIYIHSPQKPYTWWGQSWLMKKICQTLNVWTIRNARFYAIDSLNKPKWCFTPCPQHIVPLSWYWWIFFPPLILKIYFRDLSEKTHLLFQIGHKLHHPLHVTAFTFPTYVLNSTLCLWDLFLLANRDLVCSINAVNYSVTWIKHRLLAHSAAHLGAQLGCFSFSLSNARLKWAYLLWVWEDWDVEMGFLGGQHSVKSESVWLPGRAWVQEEHGGPTSGPAFLTCTHRSTCGHVTTPSLLVNGESGASSFCGPPDF